MIDAPLVLAFSGDAALARPEVLRAEVYSGGVRLHLGFGPLDGKTLTLVFWLFARILAPGWASWGPELPTVEADPVEETRVTP